MLHFKNPLEYSNQIFYEDALKITQLYFSPPEKVLLFY